MNRLNWHVRSVLIGILVGTISMGIWQISEVGIINGAIFVLGGLPGGVGGWIGGSIGRFIGKSKWGEVIGAVLLGLFASIAFLLFVLSCGLGC